MRLRLTFFLLISIFVIACNGTIVKQSKPNPIAVCVPESNKDLVIKWGNYLTKKEKLINGFVIKSNGSICRLENILDTSGVEILDVSDSVYCIYKNNVDKTIIKNQLLNVFSDTTRFIIVENPKTQYVFRAFWNPNYFDKNIRNLEFGALFTQYMLLLPKEEILKGQ